MAIPVWQYQQRGEPFTIPDVPDLREAPGGTGVVPGLKRFPYQAVARPIDPPTAAAPDLSWVLRDLPFARLPRPSGLTALVPLPFDLPLLDPAPMLRRRPSLLGGGSTFYGQADAVVVPDLIALQPQLPLPRQRLTPEAGGGLVTLAESPNPGDLATTVVVGTAPCTIIPSGMTPGDDTDG